MFFGFSMRLRLLRLILLRCVDIIAFLRTLGLMLTYTTTGHRFRDCAEPSFAKYHSVSCGLRDLHRQRNADSHFLPAVRHYEGNPHLRGWRCHSCSWSCDMLLHSAEFDQKHKRWRGHQRLSSVFRSCAEEGVSLVPNYSFYLYS